MCSFPFNLFHSLPLLLHYSLPSWYTTQLIIFFFLHAVFTFFRFSFQFQKIDKEKLTSSVTRRISADDERKSAKNIGFMGIAVFALIFGTVFIMDIQALKRDALILLENLCDGFGRGREQADNERREQ